MEDKRLELLLTYTTFHIGVYVALIAGLLGAGVYTSLSHPILRYAAVCFLIAGICGAVIASNIPDYTEYERFANDKLGFWCFKLFSFKVWGTIEHLAFWAGILPIVAAYVIRGAEAFRP